MNHRFPVGCTVGVTLKYRREPCRKFNAIMLVDFVWQYERDALRSTIGTVVPDSLRHHVSVLWDGQPRNDHAWLYPTAELVDA